MDINLLRARQIGSQERRKLLLMSILPFLYRHNCLYINCKTEQRSDVVAHLKRTLDFRDEPRIYKQEICLGPNHAPVYSVAISDAQISEQRVPGPLFSGSTQALHWLAGKLRDANVDCRVGRCSEKTFLTLRPFRYPRWPACTLAEAFEENRQRDAEELIGQVNGRGFLT